MNATRAQILSCLDCWPVDVLEVVIRLHDRHSISLPTDIAYAILCEMAIENLIYAKESKSADVGSMMFWRE